MPVDSSSINVYVPILSSKKGKEFKLTIPSAYVIDGFDNLGFEPMELVGNDNIKWGYDNQFKFDFGEVGDSIPPMTAILYQKHSVSFDDPKLINLNVYGYFVDSEEDIAFLDDLTYMEPDSTKNYFVHIAHHTNNETKVSYMYEYNIVNEYDTCLCVLECREYDWYAEKITKTADGREIHAYKAENNVWYECEPEPQSLSSWHEELNLKEINAYEYRVEPATSLFYNQVGLFQDCLMHKRTSQHRLHYCQRTEILNTL